MKPDISFWHTLTELISTQALIIDRPKSSPHPRYAGCIYPLDYGYLEKISASDGCGIDVWFGSLIKVTHRGNQKH